jgi:hypothetical protein
VAGVNNIEAAMAVDDGLPGRPGRRHLGEELV